LLGGAVSAEKGVKALCVAKNGLGMITEYVTFKRPRATAIKMTKEPFMFEAFLGSWNFKEIKGMSTEVVFLYSYKLRFPFSLFGKFIRVKLQGDVKKRLIDLKNHIEAA
jgi:ribosome-associated toxin RatA of RatAB toxin-antitoxin module